MARDRAVAPAAVAHRDLDREHAVAELGPRPPVCVLLAAGGISIIARRLRLADSAALPAEAGLAD